MHTRSYHLELARVLMLCAFEYSAADNIRLCLAGQKGQTSARITHLSRTRRFARSTAVCQTTTSARLRLSPLNRHLFPPIPDDQYGANIKEPTNSPPLVLSRLDLVAAAAAASGKIVIMIIFLTTCLNFGRFQAATVFSSLTCALHQPQK